MGNSAIQFADVCDVIAAKGIPDPRKLPAGFGDKLGLTLGSQVMADIVTERFNWKWNSNVATPFYTNSWQQDYPQPAQANGVIGWGESVTLVDINNTSIPKPMRTDPLVTWRRQLSPTNQNLWWISAVCWMYNRDLQLGAWPGAAVTYYDLVGTTPQQQNPLMSMRDKNGNILIVTTFGVTGTTAPFLPANSAEGATVTDGTVVWTAVSPNSQGFRVDCLPAAAGPALQVTPTYQGDAVKFTKYSQMLDPIPDSFSQHFFDGLEYKWLMASSNPADQARGRTAYAIWLKALVDIMKQGDKETNVFALLPASSPVQDYPWRTGRRTVTRPWG